MRSFILADGSPASSSTPAVWPSPNPNTHNPNKCHGWDWRCTHMQAFSVTHLSDRVVGRTARTHVGGGNDAAGTSIFASTDTQFCGTGSSASTGKLVCSLASSPTVVRWLLFVGEGLCFFHPSPSPTQLLVWTPKLPLSPPFWSPFWRHERGGAWRPQRCTGFRLALMALAALVSWHFGGCYQLSPCSGCVTRLAFSRWSRRQLA